MIHNQSTGSLTPFEKSISFAASFSSNMFFFETFQSLVKQIDNAEIRKKLANMNDDRESLRHAASELDILLETFQRGAMFLEDDA